MSALGLSRFLSSLRSVIVYANYVIVVLNAMRWDPSGCMLADRGG